MMIFFSILILIAGLLFAGQWLLAHPGEIAVQWFGYEVTVHIIVVAAVILIVIVLSAILSISLWHMLSWSKRRRARRQTHALTNGLKQLTLGVTALAMGDETLAHAALKKASLALPNDPLPQLLTAQLLQRQGKHADARVTFQALLSHPVTAPLATRRLIEQHISAREWHEAATLAHTARKEAPKDRWLVLTLLDLHARDGDYAPMLALTEGWQWQSPLSKPERHRYAALAYYLMAKLEREPRKQQHYLRYTLGYAPDFLPAIIDMASLTHEEGQAKRARKWLLSAWKTSPNAMLIAPILATIHDETPRRQLRLLRPFIGKANHANHHLLKAQHAFAVGDLSEAKQSVNAALAREESKAACLLMASIEQQLSGTDAQNQWLTRAISAPSSAPWACTHCTTRHEEWQVHCSHCDHFDTVTLVEAPAIVVSGDSGHSAREITA